MDAVCPSFTWRFPFYIMSALCRISNPGLACSIMHQLGCFERLLFSYLCSSAICNMQVVKLSVITPRIVPFLLHLLQTPVGGETLQH